MSKNKFLEKMLKATKNKHASIAADGLVGEDCIYYDTGVHILNAQLSASLNGGIPSNLITAFAGAESVGKTFLCLSVCKNVLDNYKDANIIYFESEGAISEKMLKDRDFDLERFSVVPIATIEEFRTQVMKVLDIYELEDTKKKLILVLDSLGNLSTNKEVKDISEGNTVQDMTRQRLIKGAFRVITLRLKTLNIPMLITNHVYARIGSPDPTPEMAGGGGLKYCASNILFLGKRKEKDGKEIIGAIIPTTLKKGRYTKENSKIFLNLRYDTGLSKYYGLIDLALDHGILKKIGNRIEINGKTIYEKTIYENPEQYFTEELMAKLEIAAKKEFSYG